MPGSKLGVPLRLALAGLLVAVPGLVAPAVVVVVVQVEQVFDAQGSRVDAMGGTEMALNLVKAWVPVAVHVPAWPGDSRHAAGGQSD